MKEPKKETVFVHIRGFKDFKRMLILQKQDFTVSQTGYTSHVKGPNLPFNYLFSAMGKNQKVIYLHAKIKSAVQNSGIYVDPIKTEAIRYFDLSNISPIRKNVVYNLDLTSAYPTQLMNFGAIPPELYKELHKEGVKKKDRLKATGMLATNRTITTYVKGKYKGVKFKAEDTRDIFFALCHEVGETINNCMKAAPSYLFYWFDGIYFTNKKDISKIQQVVKYCGFESKVEVLTDFYVGKTNRVIYISYLKEGKRKRFVLPVMNDKVFFERNMKQLKSGFDA